MNDALLAAVLALWVIVVILVVVIFALARQIGILYERIAPMGALMLDDGPTIGQQSPHFKLVSLNGSDVNVGEPSNKSSLIFFLSPTCPVCKKLIPVLRSMMKTEQSWLEILLASDGEENKQRNFYKKANLEDFPYVLSHELGMTFRVSKLPYAVLIDEEGKIQSKGLINSREQLESLFTARELGVESIQEYLEKA